MALTAKQVDDFKIMFKVVYQRAPDWLIDQLLVLLSPAQDDTAYDFLRTTVLSHLDEQKVSHETAATEYQNQKANFPSRT